MLKTDYNLNQDLAGGDHGRCNQNAASGARVLGGVLRLVGKVCCKDCRKQKSKGFADSPTSSVDAAFGSRSVGPSN